MKRTLFTFAAVLALVSSVPLVFDADDSEALSFDDGEESSSDWTPFDITYELLGETYTVHYDSPSNRVVAFGYAAVLTVLDCGVYDKLYATDKYGNEALAERGKDPVLELGGLNNDGSIGSTAKTLFDALGEKILSKDDTIILTTYSSNSYLLKNKLENDVEEGFRHVLYYGTMKTYDDVIGCVKDIVMAVGGSAEIVGQMTNTRDDVSSKLAGIDPTDVMYVTPPTDGDWGRGNTGSLTVSLMEAAGGNNIGRKEGSSSSVIRDTNEIVNILGEHPDAVILIDSTYRTKYGGTPQQFITDVLKGHAENYKIVIIEKSWNNYDPESAVGLWEIASVLHPDKISGHIPVYRGETKAADSNIQYTAALTAAAVIASVIFFVFSILRSNGEANVRKKRAVMCLFVSLVLLIVAAVLDASWTSSGIAFGDFVDVLFGNADWKSTIITNNNAVRVCLGFFVGAGLAVSGAAMQAMFRNPMASPYILGLSSGASLGAAIAVIMGVSFIPMIVLRPVLAFVMCFVTMFLVYGMSRVGGTTHTETLILTGIAVSALMSAVVSFLTFIAGDKMEDIVFWSMGSLSRSTADEVLVIGPVIAVGVAVMFCYSKALNAMMLGDAHAMDLGIDVGKTRLILLTASTVVTAAAVAFAGTIGFVGLVIPHVIRIVMGPGNRLLMPISVFAGGAFLILCDFLSHTVAPMYGVLPIGVLTAFVGAPYFVYLLRRRRNEVGW